MEQERIRDNSDDTKEAEFTLLLPLGREDAGVLLHRDIEVPLKGAWTRLVLKMADAMQFDSDLPQLVRGWRKADYLADAVGARSGWIPEVSTIRTYLYRIQREILKVHRRVRRKGHPPQFIERRRGWGARLATSRLIIIDPHQMRKGNYVDRSPKDRRFDRA